MTAFTISPPFKYFPDSDGSPLENGNIFVGTINLNPETNPIQLYSDQLLTQPLAQPLRTSGGYIVKDGNPISVYTTTSYSMTVRDKNLKLVYSIPDSTAVDNSLNILLLLASSSGSSLIGYNQGGVDAVTQTVEHKLQQYLSVKDFGATGDAVTDDTDAIVAADVEARLTNQSLYFPAGIYMVSQLTVFTGSHWFGDSRGGTIIRQIIGSNTDLIYGDNSNSNWGNPTPVLIVNGCILKDLSFDGNYNGGAGNTSGSGVAIYGARPVYENIYISNVPEIGMRTEYVDTAAGGLDTFGMEGFFKNVIIDTVGKFGWLNNGPHGSTAIGVTVIDASQDTNNMWDGIFCNLRSDTALIGVTVRGRDSTVNRMRYGLWASAGSKGACSGGCSFQGAQSAVVNISSSKWAFDNSTRYYGAWGINTLVLSGTCTHNTIKGFLGEPAPGPSIGLQIGLTAPGDVISDNAIELQMVEQNAGNVIWAGTTDFGNNVIKAYCYNSAGGGIGGAVNPTTSIDIYQNVAGISILFRNKIQTITLGIGASASVTWNFQFAFSNIPFVTWSFSNPTAPMANGSWITALSATSVTIFNNSAASATIHIIAVADTL